MKCKLVDVFTHQKLQGNGLTIFYDFDELSGSDMLALTQEMRQFESIFLSQNEDGFRARIFTVEEELDFAGHPLLGLAYHLHESFGQEPEHQWQVQLNSRAVNLVSRQEGDLFMASMSQGVPEYIKVLSHEDAEPLYRALNLYQSELELYPAEVISTGLPYVILPVDGGLEMIAFKVPDLTPLLEPMEAKFLYVLDINTFEGRTWDNAGKVEDIATGSAAGPAAAYLFKRGFTASDQITLQQGRFVGRPSRITVDLLCDGPNIRGIHVSGNVVKVADMTFV